MDQNDSDVMPPSRLATALKWGLGLVGLAVFSRLIMSAVVGLLGLAIFAIVGLAWIKFAPAIATILADLALKLLKAEATRNPIEALQNLYADKTQELHDADTAIEEFSAGLMDYDSSLKKFKQRQDVTDEEVQEWQADSDKQHELLTAMLEGQREARVQLQSLQLSIGKAEDMYKMALQLRKVTELAGRNKSEVYQEIRQKVAFDAVQHQVNRSFASLNMALARRSEHLAPPSSSTAPQVQARIPVPRKGNS
ncbi:MAG TPA: hypothetical protein VH116_04525 [Gemmatimonadales bacterium]|nr:hypothetical protein [Gemmatimonadales bacterium]